MTVICSVIKKLEQMTRKQCKDLLPIIEAFANGENVEFFDSMQINEDGSRGLWRTADDIGFGRPVDTYRVIRSGKPVYFKRKEKDFYTSVRIVGNNHTCPRCKKTHTLNAYAIAQRAMHHELIFNCECGNKYDI